MNLSTKPLYLLLIKTRETITRISETIADIRENNAKTLQTLTIDNRNQRATIPRIFKKPVLLQSASN